MARPLRVTYPGALYHIIVRGNAKQDIFLDDKDRRKFLSWLANAVKTHNLVVYAYCLMSNHFHLLVETPDANISGAMRDLNGNYSQWFNFRHGRVGHLVQDRFKAFVVEKESYLLAVARYIVLNAVRAGLVDHPRKWKWCSYSATAGLTKAPSWLNVDWILGNFGNTRSRAQKAYRRFVEDGIGGPDPHKGVEHDFILGTPQFVHWIWDNHTTGSEKLKDYPREQRIVGRPTLKELFDTVTTLKERDSAICLARLRCGYLNTEIARHIGLSNSTIGKIVRGTYNRK
ncbi:MAG TPA: transposase [Patescibacteria group bacterium]|nr:transposase [Patescibacteria group bacterium]